MSITRESLLTYLRERQGAELSDDDDDVGLFSGGILDSFTMVDLIVFLEKEGQFKMRPSEVTLENLDSVEKILSYVQTKVPEEELS